MSRTISAESASDRPPEHPTQVGNDAPPTARAPLKRRSLPLLPHHFQILRQAARWRSNLPEVLHLRRLAQTIGRSHPAYSQSQRTSPTALQAGPPMQPLPTATPA